MTYRNPKLLRLARDCPRCMSCGKTNQGDVVAAHRNEGKGIGLKTTDALVAYLCHECHTGIDNGKYLTKEDRRMLWLEAYANTMRWLIENSILKI